MADPQEIEEEIEKLKMRKVEITNRMNATVDYDEREEMRDELNKIQRQIDILEKMRVS